MADDSALLAFVGAIVQGDRADVSRRLAADPALASAQIQVGASRNGAAGYFLDEILHHIYKGDTAIHVAAAAYEPRLIRDLVRAGAGVDVANRRGAQPLHYAVDGGPGSPRWDPPAQHETVACLIELGADPNATDKNGTTPLLRAIRNRCAAAVEALLDHGADPFATNKSGSTAMQLADWTTGRGGSGSPEAKAQQQEIVRLLQTSQLRTRGTRP
jgi:ankyrin repeat protein